MAPSGSLPAVASAEATVGSGTSGNTWAQGPTIDAAVSLGCILSVVVFFIHNFNV